MPSDAVLTVAPSSGLYDFSIDQNGDIKTEEFFDTSLLYSIYGERRASPDEVVEPQLRRGWIGNSEEFENGSKIWLLSQARLTRSNLNRLQDEAKKAIQWLVDDGYAVLIDNVTATVTDNGVLLDVTIRRSRDKIDRRFFKLWEQTGNAD